MDSKSTTSRPSSGHVADPTTVSSITPSAGPSSMILDSPSGTYRPVTPTNGSEHPSTGGYINGSLVPHHPVVAPPSLHFPPKRRAVHRIPVPKSPQPNTFNGSSPNFSNPSAHRIPVPKTPEPNNSNGSPTNFSNSSSPSAQSHMKDQRQSWNSDPQRQSNDYEPVSQRQSRDFEVSSQRQSQVFESPSQRQSQVFESSSQSQSQEFLDPYPPRQSQELSDNPPIPPLHASTPSSEPSDPSSITDTYSLPISAPSHPTTPQPNRSQSPPQSTNFSLPYGQVPSPRRSNSIEAKQKLPYGIEDPSRVYANNESTNPYNNNQSQSASYDHSPASTMGSFNDFPIAPAKSSASQSRTTTSHRRSESFHSASSGFSATQPLYMAPVQPTVPSASLNQLQVKQQQQQPQPIHKPSVPNLMAHPSMTSISPMTSIPAPPLPLSAHSHNRMNSISSGISFRSLGASEGSLYVKQLRRQSATVWTNVSSSVWGLPIGIAHGSKSHSGSAAAARPNLRKFMDARHTHLAPRLLASEADEDDSSVRGPSIDVNSRQMSTASRNNVNIRHSGSQLDQSSLKSSASSFKDILPTAPVGLGASFSSYDHSAEVPVNKSPMIPIPRSPSESSVKSVEEPTGKIRLFVANPDESD